MEKTDDKKNKTRKIEGIVLIAYCIYNIGISTNITANNWERWTVYIINAGWLLSLLVYIGRYRSYRFRAFFTSVMLQVGMILYTIQVPDLFTELINVIATIIVLSLYGIPNIICMMGGSVTFLFCYYLIFFDVFRLTEEGDIPRLLQKITSVYFVIYLMYYLVKKQRKTNQEQQKIIERLENAEHSKDDFLANVSHEIRTPINTICGMCEVVLKEELKRSVKEDIFNIQMAGRNLLSVVSDVLDFSQLQSGKFELAEINYSAASMINDVINVTMVHRYETPVIIIVDCKTDMPSGLYGDEQKIRRVVLNLMNNAIKFTKEGFVSVTFDARKTSYGVNLIVTIKDTGIGMSEESIEKLFTSYNQVNTKRNRQESGIGLGIAISQAIVEEMGGFITVKSELGKGSELRVVIPQKVIDDAPIVSVKQADQIYAAFYVNREKMGNAEMRGQFSKNISHMMEQLGVKFHLFHKLDDLKNKIPKEEFTHIFISLTEYQEDENYFDELAQYTKVAVLIDQGEDEKIQNENLLCIYKPFFVLPVAYVLNDAKNARGTYGNSFSYGGFIAPEAHVLVVDDNNMNLKVAEGLLQSYQIKVSKATSGREALDKVDRMDYDMILMDHMMPEMDGVETLQRIRQKKGEHFKTVPVIALTANAVAGRREEFLSVGFQDFIAKPIEISVLERVLIRNIPGNKIVRLTVNEREQKKEQRKPEEQVTFSLGDLDVKQGLTYCGGMQTYMEVLEIHCQEGEEKKKELEKYYQAKDWKNYTVLVHATKGSMKNIGAMALSEMAKGLEQAGKNQDEQFINRHHDEMIKEYERVLAMICEQLGKSTEDKSCVEQQQTEVEELSEEEFAKLAEELEESGYALDGESMLAIVEKMQAYCYHGYVLKDVLEPVKRKIEMSDYMSASEVVQRLKVKQKGVV